MSARRRREIRKPLPVRDWQARRTRETDVITGQFECDYQALQQVLADCADLKSRVIHTASGRPVALFYFNGLVDETALADNIVRRIQDYAGQLTVQQLIQRVISAPDTKTETNVDNIVRQLTDGSVAIIVEGLPTAILPNISQYENRGIERTKSEDVIIGPHHSFGEDLATNLALLRRHLSSGRLKIRFIELGSLSRTKVAILYLQGLCQEELVGEVESRLTRIKIDYVPGAAYLTDFLEDQPGALFPQIAVTEKPVRVTAALSEGRVVVIAENDPSALIAPAFLPEALQASEDYSERPVVGTFLRLVRLFSVTISVFLPGVWIALAAFHHGILPPTLFNSIVAGRQGVPLPSVLEAFLLLLAFDLIVEASTRLPATVGQAVGIVGAIILGQSAVQASLVSPTMTIVAALSGLAGFTLPSPILVGPVRIAKYLVIVPASIFGLFGVVWALIFLAIEAVSIRSFGYPLLFPVAPFNLRGELDILIKLPNYWLKARPALLAQQDQRRMSEGLTPQPGKGTSNED
ncbi:MAG: spore germination protein [Bacillota bacterium]|jgi:spore germination protein KA